jgi:hypothetical protein
MRRAAFGQSDYRGSLMDRDQDTHWCYDGSPFD